MQVYVAEFVGTALLLLLGNGVVANVVLAGTKGHNSGWLVICTGWGLSVYAAVLCVGDVSGAHLNPAVTVGVAAAGEFAWQLVPGYIAAQLLGAMTGAGLVVVCYWDHYRATTDPGAVLGSFCTSPAIRSLPRNVLCEALGTFVLVYAVLRFADPSFVLPATVDAEQTVQVGLGSLGAIRVGLIVFVIGLCLGGPTGYAINPARDLGPRIVHALTPLPSRGISDWSYAGVPVLGPLAGGCLAAALHRLLPFTT